MTQRRARLNTEYLRYFLAVAEELHFGRAARRLSMAQQPLSRQVQRLERELGTRLFDRTTRRVTLTPAGEVFAGEVRRALAALDGAVEAARRAERGEVGRLVVGYTATALYSVLPEAVRAFRGRFPDVQLDLAEMSSEELEAALLAGDLQAAFLYGSMDGPGVESAVLRREPLVAALPGDHPLADRPEVALGELAQEPFVLFPRRMRPSLYDRILGFCREAGFSPRVVQEAAPEQTIIGMVAAGIGVALVFSCLRELNRPGVVYRPLTGVDTSVEFDLAWRADDPSPALRAFTELTREVAAS
jgi:DNA-binding transcriptional LysR family regulator